MSKYFFLALLYIIGAPFAGGLLEGIDRKVSARMQGRKGPSLLQPFYDLNKLFAKQSVGAEIFCWCSLH